MPTFVRAAYRWQYLVDTMLYRVYVVAWEWAEEEAKYINLDRRASAVASSSKNPGYVEDAKIGKDQQRSAKSYVEDGPGKRRRSDALSTVE